MASDKSTSAGSVVLMLLAASAAVGAVYWVVQDLKAAKDAPPEPEPRDYYRSSRRAKAGRSR